MVELVDLHIDIGAMSREEAEGLVRVGDVGRLERRAGRAPERQGDVAARSTTGSGPMWCWKQRGVSGRTAASSRSTSSRSPRAQEEIGSVGARAAAYGLDPAVAIAVDVTPATDLSGRRRATGRACSSSGMGAMIARGPTLNKLRRGAARRRGGRPKRSRTGSRCTRGRTATDADEFQSSRSGVPTGLVSIPMRYLHTPNELVRLEGRRGSDPSPGRGRQRLEPGASFVR